MSNWRSWLAILAISIAASSLCENVTRTDFFLFSAARSMSSFLICPSDLYNSQKVYLLYKLSQKISFQLLLRVCGDMLIKYQIICELSTAEPQGVKKQLQRNFLSKQFFNLHLTFYFNILPEVGSHSMIVVLLKEPFVRTNKNQIKQNPQSKKIGDKVLWTVAVETYLGIWFDNFGQLLAISSCHYFLEFRIVGFSISYLGCFPIRLQSL